MTHVGSSNNVTGCAGSQPDSDFDMIRYDVYRAVQSDNSNFMDDDDDDDEIFSIRFVQRRRLLFFGQPSMF